jgi:hypothetical protein
LVEWDEWTAAVEDFGGDPAIETFERVVAAGNKLLVALMPPPDSGKPRPNRLIPLVELWNAQAEALRNLES